MAARINNFTTIDSIYGTFVVNRHCAFQADALIKTGRPHIQDELEKLLAIVATLPDQAMVVDAGANIGLVAVPIAQALLPRGGAVIAFEIQRMLYYALCGAAALNDLENLFAYNMGLGASVRDEMINRPNYGVPQDFGLFSLLQQGESRPDKIRIITIDSLALVSLDLLKIDVEGVEIEVLRGAAESIARFKPWCWIEYWQVGIEVIKKQFDGLGYEFFVMDELNLLCAPAERLKASGMRIEARRV